LPQTFFPHLIRGIQHHLPLLLAITTWRLRKEMVEKEGLILLPVNWRVTEEKGPVLAGFEKSKWN